MKTPRLIRYPDYLLLELPLQGLVRHEIESWIAKVLAESLHAETTRILVRRKHPARLSINPGDNDRFVNLISNAGIPGLRIALSFPADHYIEELDHMTLIARSHGIPMELFFDDETALRWLLER